MVKKVYISVDIEGMEGVVSRLSISRGQSDFPVARKRLAEDVNAAIRACFDMGVEEVVVCDGHGDMENMLIEDLDPRAKLVNGAMRSSLQMQCIEEGFDAMIAFGHAGAGLSFGGVLDHCYNGAKIHNMWLNGTLMNTETVQNAHIAGHYGTPLVAMIGDKAVCEEVAKFSPKTVPVVVKEGVSRLAAKSVHPTVAREMIYDGVKKALENVSEVPALKLAEPITMEIEFKESNMAETASLIPGVDRYESRKVRYTGDFETIFKLQELLVYRLVDMLP